MVRHKMNRQERAKQFMPFAALKGYMEALRERERLIEEQRKKSKEDEEMQNPF